MCVCGRVSEGSCRRAFVSLHNHKDSFTTLPRVCAPVLVAWHAYCNFGLVASRQQTQGVCQIQSTMLKQAGLLFTEEFNTHYRNRFEEIEQMPAFAGSKWVILYMIRSFHFGSQQNIHRFAPAKSDLCISFTKWSRS